MRTSSGNQKYVLWATSAMAVITAITYILMVQGFLGVGDIKADGKLDVIIYTAAGSYLLGAVLIFARRRGLWITGAVINMMVMMMYFKMHAGDMSVLLSPGGLSSKVAQILLELGLIYMIATFRRNYVRNSAPRIAKSLG